MKTMLAASLVLALISSALAQDAYPIPSTSEAKALEADLSKITPAPFTVLVACEDRSCRALANSLLGSLTNAGWKNERWRTAHYPEGIVLQQPDEKDRRIADALGKALGNRFPVRVERHDLKSVKILIGGL